MRENSWKAIYLALFIIAMGFFVSSHIGMGDGLVWSTAVQEDGVLVGARPILNFINGVDATDNLGDNRIDLTLPGELPPARGRADNTTLSYVTFTSGMVTFNYGDVLTANRLYYEPFSVRVTTVVDKLAVGVKVAGAGGTHIRLGIYNADTDWQPTTLVIDAGTVTADSVAVPKEIDLAPNITLVPGLYLACFVSDGAPTMWEVETPSPVTATTSFYPCQEFYDAFVYDVLPGSGQTWTNYLASYNSHRRIIFKIIP